LPTLDWMTREGDVSAAESVPYRLLEAQPELNGGDSNAANMLIQGDNLDALKALLPYYAGRVKCIYIDPPYNTRSAFEHYDDNLEHSQWLAMIYPRLVLLRDLVAEDGSIWVNIDDHEAHYLKVIMDEIFGRNNFIGNVVWQSKDTPGNDAATIAQTHNHILVYGRSAEWRPNLIPRNEKQLANYKNPDNDPRGPWLGTPLTRAEHRERDVYEIKNAAGRMVSPPRGSSWRRPPAEIERLSKEDRIYWGKTGDAAFPVEKKFLSEVKAGVVPQTWWPYELAGSTRNASAELKRLFGGVKAFDTPKPERLIERVLTIATNPGDMVLDSFLGSGTTAATAHKMGRRWIGIEMGEHAATHCKPRLDRVIEGEQGGVSKAVGWSGGGGYRFYRLGDAVFDADGAILADIRFPTLAAHIWFSETATPYEGDGARPVLGIHNGTAYALLYNGILGDRSVTGGNVLTSGQLDRLRQQANGWNGPWVIYGEATRLGGARLTDESVAFKQTPYDVRAR